MRFLKNISTGNRTDEELAAAYQRTGDTLLVSQLLQRYMDYLYGVCLKYLEDPEAARDAVMDIYSVLCEKLSAHSVTHFRGWLHVLARNHCLMQLRKGRRIHFTEYEPGDVMQNGVLLHPESDWLERETQLGRLEDCLGLLVAEQKTSITLFYLEKKCYQEIAAITGFEWNKVRSYIQNGRRNLRQCMENKQEEKDA